MGCQIEPAFIVIRYLIPNLTSFQPSASSRKSEISATIFMRYTRAKLQVEDGFSTSRVMHLNVPTATIITLKRDVLCERVYMNEVFSLQRGQECSVSRRIERELTRSSSVCDLLASLNVDETRSPSIVDLKSVLFVSPYIKRANLVGDCLMPSTSHRVSTCRSSSGLYACYAFSSMLLVVLLQSPHRHPLQANRASNKESVLARPTLLRARAGR
jgi:hypothetical protein